MESDQAESTREVAPMKGHRPPEREVKCPFFKFFGDRRIVCEGHHDGLITLSQMFRDNRAMDLQASVFCSKDYKKCEIYRMIMGAKYEDANTGAE